MKILLNKEKFVERAQEADWEEEIDGLCLEWLRGVADEAGSSGRTARKLLEIVEELIS